MSDKTKKIEEMGRRELEEHFKALRRIHNSINNVVVDLQAKVAELEQELALRTRQLENAENAVAIQRSIVITQIQQSAEKERQLVERIEELRKKLKLLGSK